MRSSRIASLTRLVIGASILAGLIGTTATSALAANAPVTFAILREELPVAPVDTVDQTYRDTDTVTGTGDTATGITVTLSSTSPSQNASIQIIAPTGGPLVAGSFNGVLAAPAAARPGMVVTIDGTVCNSSAAALKINQMGFDNVTPTDVSILHIYFEMTCPAAGFGEVHGLVAINSTATLSALASNPANTQALGNVNIGATSAPKTVVYTNIGNNPIDMSTLALGGRYPEMYTLTDNCTTLAAGASCTATVTFKPTTYDLREASVILPGDLSLEDLKKEVLLTGTGLLTPNGPNDTPANAIDISTLPFYSGVQVDTIDPSPSPCATVAADRAGWWHFKSTTGSKTVALSTTQSDVGTSIALYSGAGASTFIKCGANADAALHDSLSFAATNNVDYYIRIQRETPGEQAIVLKAVLGAPDTTVEVTGFMTNYGTIYPVVDGYRDSIDIRATRNETASASIAIYNPAGSKIRTLTVPSGIGQYSVAWNGRNTAGTVQPAGKYKIISTVTDTSGNKLSDTRFVTVSLKKLVTKTYTQTLDAAKYTKLLTTGRATTSKTSTAYAGGLKMTSSSNGTIAAIYSFSAPAAYSYTSVTFTVIGKGATNTMTLGLQDWTRCTTYDTACVGAIHDGPHSAGTASAAVSAPATNTIYSTIHRIRGYLFAPTMVGVTRTLDARDVKITVTYKVLG